MDLLLRRRQQMSVGEAVPEFYSYIQGSSSAYLNTGITLPNNAVIAVHNVMGVAGSNRILCGAYDGSYYTRIRQVNSSGSAKWGWTYDGGSEVSKNQGNFYNPISEMGTIVITPTAGIRNETKSVSITKGSHKPNAAFCIMAAGANDGATRYYSRIGSVYIYGSDASGITAASQLANYTPLYSFIPCKYKGQSGMWCNEESRFIGPVTGTLTVSNS